MSVHNSFDNRVKDSLGFLENDYVNASLYLFLILYAGVIAPKLPVNVLKWFTNWFVQIIMFFLIVFISGKNATVALATAIAVLVTLMIANGKITLESIKDLFTSEKPCLSCGEGKNMQDGSLSSDPNTEPEYPSRSRNTNAFENQTGGEVTGVKQSDIENDVIGSSLDDDMPMGSENASY